MVLLILHKMMMKVPFLYRHHLLMGLVLHLLFLLILFFYLIVLVLLLMFLVVFELEVYLCLVTSLFFLILFVLQFQVIFFLVNIFVSYSNSLPFLVAFTSATIFSFLNVSTSFCDLIVCSSNSLILFARLVLKSFKSISNSSIIFFALSNAISNLLIEPDSAFAVISVIVFLISVGDITVFCPADTVFITVDIIAFVTFLISDSDTDFLSAIIFYLILLYYLCINQTTLRRRQQQLTLDHFVPLLVLLNSYTKLLLCIVSICKLI